MKTSWQKVPAQTAAVLCFCALSTGSVGAQTAPAPEVAAPVAETARPAPAAEAAEPPAAAPSKEPAPAEEEAPAKATAPAPEATEPAAAAPSKEPAPAEDEAPAKATAPTPGAAEPAAAAPSKEPAPAKEGAPAKATAPAPEAAQPAAAAAPMKPASAKDAVPGRPSKADLNTNLESTSAAFGKLAAASKRLYEQRKADKQKDAANIQASYKQFGADLVEAQAAVKALRALGDSSKGALGEFFAAWKAKIASIRDEDVRKTSEKRLKKATEALAEYTESLKKLDVLVTATLGKGEDVQKALQFDLSPDSLDDVSGALDALADDCGDIQEGIVKAREKIKDLPEMGEPAAQ